LPQDRFHLLPFCELVDQLVEVANFLHQRIFDIFHAHPAHYAFDERTIWMHGRCLRKEGLKVGFLLNLPA
jgi:hypothetical protein